jgi:hypothetical protein
VRFPLLKTVDLENGAGHVVEPKGEGMKRAIGEMISCPICAGTWIAAGLVYGLQFFPKSTRLFLWAIQQSALLSLPIRCLSFSPGLQLKVGKKPGSNRVIVMPC